MSLTTTTDQRDVINVLRASLYPGAKTESIELVLAYCRMNGLDPMLKPVHIVPTSVKTGNGWEMRDVLMPGIADYRIKAARSGEYLGKSEPVFGPVMSTTLNGVDVTYPEWCKITIRRLVGGKEAEFTATEYWLENYATQKRDTSAPNAMWKKRAFGQLAKCTEAQVLRMAFPEFSGGAVTAEEMEGKTIEGHAEIVRNPPPRSLDAVDAPEPQRRTVRQFLDDLEAELRECQAWDDLLVIEARDDVRKARDTFVNGAAERLGDMLDAARERLAVVVVDGEAGDDAA
jgi:phage recombination protein Bet